VPASTATVIAYFSLPLTSADQGPLTRACGILKAQLTVCHDQPVETTAGHHPDHCGSIRGYDSPSARNRLKSLDRRRKPVPPHRACGGRNVGSGPATSSRSSSVGGTRSIGRNGCVSIEGPNGGGASFVVTTMTNPG
jgi:hypothetical protein